MNPAIKLSSQEYCIVDEILQQYLPLAQIWVIGSRAQGKPKKFSDLDLVIDNQSLPLNLDTIIVLKECFEECDLPFMVDLLDWNTLNTSFKQTISIHRIPWKS